MVAANLLAGLTYRDMAGALNVSISTIADDVKVIIGRWQREQVRDTGEYVELELLRLDRAINAIWTKVQAGDLGAIGAMIRIQERRARYRGLDAAEKVEHSGDVNFNLTDWSNKRKERKAEVEGLEDTKVKIPEGDSPEG